MSEFTHILFDLDGTLTDPGLGITNSVMHALEHFGIRTEDRSTLYKYIGPPLFDSFREFHGFSDDDARIAIDVYREYFSVTGLFENELIPGIPELLAKCFCFFVWNFPSRFSFALSLSFSYGSHTGFA